MKEIILLTFRKKETHELIAAEGIASDELYSDLSLDPIWFTEEEIPIIKGQGWALNSDNKYYFDDQILSLNEFEYEKFNINTNEKYKFIDKFSLKISE